MTYATIDAILTASIVGIPLILLVFMALDFGAAIAECYIDCRDKHCKLPEIDIPGYDELFAMAEANPQSVISEPQEGDPVEKEDYCRLPEICELTCDACHFQCSSIVPEITKTTSQLKMAIEETEEALSNLSTTLLDNKTVVELRKMVRDRNSNLPKEQRIKGAHLLNKKECLAVLC